MPVTASGRCRHEPAVLMNNGSRLCGRPSQNSMLSASAAFPPAPAAASYTVTSKTPLGELVRGAEAPHPSPDARDRPVLHQCS